MKRYAAILFALVMLLGFLSADAVPALAEEIEESTEAPVMETEPPVEAGVLENSEEANPDATLIPGSNPTVDAITSGLWEYQLSEGDAVLTAYHGTSTYITVPSSIDGLTVVGIGDSVFRGRYDIVSVTLPSTLESIGSYAFDGCKALKSITLPVKLESVGYSAFYNCESLSSVTVNSVKLSDFYGSGNTFYNAGKESGGMTVTFGSGVTRIPANMFECSADYYARVKSVSISSSVTEIGFDAFRACYDLTTVTIPSGSVLESIGNYAFDSCVSLTSVVLPAKLESVGYSAFYNCESLSSVTVNSVKLSDFYGSGNTFYNAGKESGGMTVTFGSGVTRIPANMFECSADYYARVKSVSISSSVTEIGFDAFRACYDLTTVTIPSDSALALIEDYAFNGCEDLKSISLPKKLEAVGYSAFNGCEALTSVVFYEELESLESYAFAGCESLKTIRFWGEAPTFGSYAFEDVTATVYYPAGSSTWTASKRQNYGGTLNWVMASIKAPTVKVTNVASSGKPKLTWNAVDGATSYKVYRSTSKSSGYKLLTTISGTSLTNSSAVAGTQYYYYVIAVGSGGTVSDKSNIVTRTCDLPRPDVSVTNVPSTGKIKLSWPKVSGAVKYEVYRATSKDGTYTKLSTVTSTSLTNASTTAGKTYYYKVKAIHSNSAANSAYSVVDSRTCDLPQPDVTVSNVASTGKIKLSWAKISGAVKYEIYRATSKDGTYTKLSTVTGTSLTNTSTTAGKTYYYKVKAIHSNSSANSAYSTLVGRTCDLPRPTVKVTLNSSGKPVITWAKIDGAVKYTVYIYDANGKQLKTTTITSTKLTHSSAVKGTIYQYRVVAVASNTAANSAKSSTVSIASK